MNKLRETIRRIPRYGWICGAVYFVAQYSIYRLGDWLSRLLGTIDRAFPPKIAFIDDVIPVVPVFAVIYLFSYIFWICGPIAGSLAKKRIFVNYMFGLTLAYIIGFLFFVFMPTCMDRAAEGIMEVAERPGFFNWLLRIIYGADGSGTAFNLFPSYHCLISIYCYLGVRKQPEVPKGFRVYSLVMALLICASTVLTKQHYAIDIPGGILISLFCYWLMNKLDPGAKWVAKHGEKAAVNKEAAA